MSKSSFHAIIILAIALVWIASGYIFPSKTKENKKEVVTSEMPRVRVEKSTSNDRQKTLELIGTTKPSQEVEIKAEVSGKVEKIVTKEGSLVKQGDIILIIEKRNKQARVNELRALVDQKQIALSSSESLTLKGLSSRSSVAKARSELESAKASLIQAEIDLKSTVVRAPFSGILEKVNVEEGDFVQVGFGGDFDTSGSFAGASVAKIINNSPFKIEAGVSEKIGSEIKEGMKAKVKLISGEVVNGVVTYISKVALQETRTFKIEVTVNDPKVSASSGTTATIELGLSNLSSHKIPASSLAISEDGRFGIKVLENVENVSDSEMKGVVKFYPVNIADSDETGVWINDLPQDILLITLGQNFVNEDATVTGVLPKDKL